jgi:hypothetical protein
VPGIVGAQDTTTSGNTPWQEFGLFLGLFHKHTGIFHNENGGHIDAAAAPVLLPKID